MGQRELARFLGCSLGNIQHHLKAGTIFYEPGTAKKFDPDICKQRLEEFTRQKSDSDDARDGKRLDYQQARMISTLYEGRLKKLDYETKAGKLVEADKVKSEFFRLGRMIRDRILNIPNRIADQIAHMTDPHETHVFLTKELTDALQELAADGKQTE